jgi:hypothetical protein
MSLKDMIQEPDMINRTLPIETQRQLAAETAEHEAELINEYGDSAMSLKDFMQGPEDAQDQVDAHLAAMNEQLNNEHQQWNDKRERIRRQIQSDFKDYLKKYPGFGGPLLAQLIIDCDLS